MSVSRAGGTNLICLTDQSDGNWPCGTEVITGGAKESYAPTGSDPTARSARGPAGRPWHPRFEGSPQKSGEPATFGSSRQTKKPQRRLVGSLNSVRCAMRSAQANSPRTGWVCRSCFVPKPSWRNSGFRASSPLLKGRGDMGRAALTGRRLPAAALSRTCERVARIEPVKASPAALPGPSASGTDGAQFSDRFHVPDGHR